MKATQALHDLGQSLWLADIPRDYAVRDVAVKYLPDRWTVEMKIPAKPN